MTRVSNYESFNNKKDISRREYLRRSRQKEMSDNIKQFGQVQLPQPPSHIHSLVIIGQIEGHMTLPAQNKTTKYEHILPQLVAAEQNPNVKGLMILLNTVGGDVEAGLAIAEMIESMSKPSVSVVLGGGHSIGAPIAVAADYSLIVETATMTIHPIRLTGQILSVPQTYDYLDKMQERVISFITKNTDIPSSELRKLMFNSGQLARDIGTLLIGRDAVLHNLIDDVGGVGKAVFKLEEFIKEREKRLPHPEGPPSGPGTQNQYYNEQQFKKDPFLRNPNDFRGPGPNGPYDPRSSKDSDDTDDSYDTDDKDKKDDQRDDDSNNENKRGED